MTARRPCVYRVEQANHLIFRSAHKLDRPHGWWNRIPLAGCSIFHRRRLRARACKFTVILRKLITSAHHPCCHAGWLPMLTVKQLWVEPIVIRYAAYNWIKLNEIASICFLIINSRTARSMGLHFEWVDIRRYREVLGAKVTNGNAWGGSWK